MLCYFRTTMAKQSNVEVQGYVHNVSEVHQSGSGTCSYFTAVFQEADRNTRMVVFDTERHNSFQCAERDR